MNKLEPGILMPVNYVRTIDGDTISFSITRTFNIRFRDIDVYELDTKLGKEAKDYVATLLRFAKDIKVFIPTNNPEKLMDFNSFERIVGDIYIDNVSLKSLLEEKGYNKDI